MEATYIKTHTGVLSEGRTVTAIDTTVSSPAAVSASVEYKQNVKYNFYVKDNGEVDIMAIVHVTEVGEDTDIFSSLATPVGTKTYGFAILDDGVSVKPYTQIKWCMTGDTQIQESKIPDEMSKPIHDAIKQTKYMAKKEGAITNEEFIEQLVVLLTPEDKKKIIEARAAFISKMTALKMNSSNLDLVAFCERYAFKKHVLIKGERGTGKTYSIDKFIKDRGYKMVFIAGHEAMESSDLMGYYIRNSDGSTVWLDGSLSEAIRLAQKEKVVLMFDEMLRTPARELNIFVASLTPSSSGTYRFKTNRVVSIEDNIATTETLEVPVDNFWVVGTTNVGSKYNVDEIDHALSDRFRIYDKDITTSELGSIFSHWLSVRGFSDKYADSFVQLYTKLSELQAAGEIENGLNARHLSEVIQYADNEKAFRSYLFDLLPNICSVDMNGKMDQAEKEIISKVIKTLF
jgi:hypothetical protein